MDIDKHKIWLISSIVIVILIIGFVFIYPNVKEGLAGKATYTTYTNDDGSIVNVENGEFPFKGKCWAGGPPNEYTSGIYSISIEEGGGLNLNDGNSYNGYQEGVDMTVCCTGSLKCVTADGECYPLKSLKQPSQKYLCDPNGDWITCSKKVDGQLDKWSNLLCKSDQWQKCVNENEGKLMGNQWLCLGNKWFKCDSSYSSGPKSTSSGKTYVCSKNKWSDFSEIEDTCIEGTIGPIQFLCLGGKMVQCDSSYSSNPQYLPSGIYVCSDNKWSEAPKTEFMKCKDSLDNDFDKYFDCADSDCKGNTIDGKTCINSYIKYFGSYDLLIDDPNSLKPENLKKRSALCTKPTDCVNANGECIGYDTPYATSGGVFNCGKDNIWKKCTPEGKNVKSEGGLFICDGTKWKLSVSLEDIPGDKKEICDNGKDDDSDLNADCGDYTDCEGISCGQGCLCVKKKDMWGNTFGAKTEAVCNDKVDNDGDSKLNCADSDCVSDLACVKTCTSNCASKTCGDDGCGGSCGICIAGETCQNGNCVITNYLDYQSDGCVNALDLAVLAQNLKVNFDPICKNKNPDFTPGEGDVTGQNGKPDGCVDALDIAVIAQDLGTKFNAACI